MTIFVIKVTRRITLTHWTQGTKLFASGGFGESGEFHFTYCGVLTEKAREYRTYRPYERDYVLIPHRVAPREFIGILVDDRGVADRRGDSDGDETRKFLISEAKKMADENFSDELSLPIYNTSGDLLWPKYIPRSVISGDEKLEKVA